MALHILHDPTVVFVKPWMGKYSRKCAGHCAATLPAFALNTFWMQHVNTSVNEIKQGQNRSMAKY